MGFLDAIGDILGGFQGVQMQDKYGPDWRAQKAKSDFALQQQQAEEERAAREFERQQEEALATQASNVLLGAPQGGEQGPLPEPDIASMLPREISEAKRKWITAQAAGKAAQTRPALQMQQFFNQQQRDAAKAEATAEQIGLRGDESQELARLRAKLQSEMKLSPAEQAKLDSLERRTGVMAAARREGVGGPGGGRPQLRQVQDEQGNTVYRWLSPGEEARAPATAVERQASGMAQTVKDNVDKMEALAGKVTSGPLAGRISKAYQSQYPSGKEADFDFLSNAVIDTVYVKSGKQINATELGILKSMIPDRARGDLPGQVERFKTYANSLLQKYGAPEGAAGPSGGGAGTPRVTSVADYAALPSGTVYIDPTGRKRRKP